MSVNFSNNLGFLITIVLMFIIGSFLVLIRVYISTGFTLFYFSLLLYLIIYYDSMDDNIFNNNKFYNNYPVDIIYLYFVFPFYVYIIQFLLKHTILFGNNITTKEDKSIEQFRSTVIENNKKAKLSTESLYYINNNFKKKNLIFLFKNLFVFYIKKVPESQISIDLN